MVLEPPPRMVSACVRTGPSQASIKMFLRTATGTAATAAVLGNILIDACEGPVLKQALTLLEGVQAPTPKGNNQIKKNKQINIDK